MKVKIVLAAIAAVLLIAFLAYYMMRPTLTVEDCNVPRACVEVMGGYR